MSDFSATADGGVTDVESVTKSDVFSSEACKFAKMLIDATDGTDYAISSDQIVSFGWIPPLGQSDQTCKDFAYAGSSLRRSRDGMFLHDELFKSNVSKQMLVLIPRFEPTGETAVKMSKFFRNHLEPDSRSVFKYEGSPYVFQAKHSSAVSVQLDAFSDMDSAAPYVFGLTFLTVIITIGLIFQVAFLPIKLTLTVAFPIIVVYGTACWVFQADGLAVFGSNFGVGSGGIAYNTMFLTAGILFGIAIDYDLFLYARVYEYRMEGYDNLSAVRLAVAETGPVITTAGTLMAISYFFVMLSSIPVIRILGFVYCFGTCLDTYIVRSSIAPACLCFFEKLNYWPALVPEPTKSLELEDKQCRRQAMRNREL